MTCAYFSMLHFLSGRSPKFYLIKSIVRACVPRTWSLMSLNLLDLQEAQLASWNLLIIPLWLRNWRNEILSYSTDFWKDQPHNQIAEYHIETVPDLPWFNLWFFNFMMVQKWYVFSKNHPLNFDLFPRLAVCRRMLSGDAGQWQEGTAPSQPRDHGGEQRILCGALCLSMFKAG